jgi:hypothetical protein
MKNILFISDLHLSMDQPVGRLDNVVETQFKKLRFVLQWACDNDCIILQAGDFFDKPRSWFLLPMVISILKEYEVPIYCVYGQHDVYMYSEETKDNTSLGVLAKAGLVTILSDKPVMLFSDTYEIDHSHPIRIYGASYGQEIPIPSSKNNEPDQVSDILVLHAPIAEEWVGGDFIDARGFLKMHPEWDIILVGDIHRKFSIPMYFEHHKHRNTEYLINTGPMLRKEATEYNFKHTPGFFCTSSETYLDKLKWISIPHEPAEKVLTRDHIIKEEDKNQMLSDFIEKIGTESGGDSVSFQEVLQGLIKEGNVDKRVQAIISEVMGQ